MNASDFATPQNARYSISIPAAEGQAGMLNALREHAYSGGKLT